MKYKTVDANEIVANVAYNYSDICGIYPITPASFMAEMVDHLSCKGKTNYFLNVVRVEEMNSEKGAIALVHGALQSGSLATTFTASQGLLLMIPSLYKLAGEMLPAVIHVAARSISTHALSIFGDHQDIYATRMTGVCILSSTSVSDAYILANVAHLSAIKSSLPFIHFFDGFRTSHEINKIRYFNDNVFKKLIPLKSLKDFKNNAMNTSNPNTRGTAQNDDIYFQNMEVRNSCYTDAFNNVLHYMEEVNKICKCDYKPFNYYGSKNAKYVIIAMGSVCNTILEVVNELNSKNDLYGVVFVRLYRPFNGEYLKNVIPKSVKSIAVLDRTKEAGSEGEPLYLDVTSALRELKNVSIYGGRYGLSSKNTSPSDIATVFDYLKRDTLFHNFTIGIDDDVTNLSLLVKDRFKLKNNNLEILVYGFGSDGMVSTSKDLLKIIGDNTNYYVQGYFQYDSKKSGSVTRCHVRIGENEINSPYYLEQENLVVIANDTYIYKYDVLDNIKKYGTLLLNTSLSEEKLLMSLPNKIKNLLIKKHIKLYTIDAYKLVNELGLKNKISTCMEVAIFSIIGIMNIKSVAKIMKDTNYKRFIDKGKNIVDINNKIVDKSLEYLKEVKYGKRIIESDYVELEMSKLEKINKLRGNELKVSDFLGTKNGIVYGNSSSEKRKIASRVPLWIPENCIQCNQCSFVCPHAVIRPFLTEKEGSIKAMIPSNKDLKINYKIGVSYEDCTSCGLCMQNCPGKNGRKAIEMVKYDENIHKQSEFNDLNCNNVNDIVSTLPRNVKNIQFNTPKFEFSGACAGCGETPYLKNLTQLYGDTLMIANATGCSSIYGASSPSVPYSIPWASSLFEDNAEYGLGILMGYNNNRDRIKNYMVSNLKKDQKLFKKWLDNMEDYNSCLEVKTKINYKKHPILNELKEYLLPINMFIVGGDGFAYDIGYDGLDHVISTNYNVNILVLDTEVYSNTGGQASKSSNIGAIAQFALNGKKNYKKDLAKIAMCYDNVYVACVNISYDKEQYVKALKEATLHNGPSLIICYAPCIEHGNKKGMEYSMENGYEATKCGYFLTFRYNPDTQKFVLDSKDIDFDKYEDFLKKENRYVNATDKNLLLMQKEWAINRYNYYKDLENK